MLIVVEDDDGVRVLAEELLLDRGYPSEQRPDDAPPGPLLRKPWRAGEFYKCLEQLIGSDGPGCFGPQP
jgi:hypothetical protein